MKIVPLLLNEFTLKMIFGLTMKIPPVKRMIKNNIFQHPTLSFRNIFDKLDSVILSIEGLKGIDRYGVNAIAQLHNEALNRKKKLSIIGLGHKEVFHHFSENDAA